MRSIVCVALLVALGGCEGKNGEAPFANEVNQASEDDLAQVTQRLKDGDLSVCASDSVKMTLFAIGGAGKGSEYADYIKEGGEYTFDKVTATGFKKDIAELSCSASYVVGPWKGTVKYIVKPALETQGNFVVESDQLLGYLFSIANPKRQRDWQAEQRAEDERRAQELAAEGESIPTASDDSGRNADPNEGDETINDDGPVQ